MMDEIRLPPTLTQARAAKLDREIQETVDECHRICAGIGAKLLAFQTAENDTARYELVAKAEFLNAEHMAWALERLKILVEKREEGAG